MTRSLPLVVLAPNFPPTICGVGDYTANLLEAWPARAGLDTPRPLRCLLRPALAGDGVSPDSARNDSTLKVRGAAVPVRAVISRAEPWRHALASLGPCHLLVQYSAYGFDPRWGCPAGLCRALASWAQAARASGGRLVIMFHELWVDEWPVWHPHYWVQERHRLALRRLARAATRIFTTTEYSARHLRRLLRREIAADPSAEITVLPAGANILPPSPAAASVAEQEPGLFILFGLQGTRLRCLRAMHADLSALARAGRLRRLVLLGCDQSAAMTAEEIALLQAALPPALGAVWERSGERPAAELSEWMQRAEYGLAFQDAANYQKSGTLMAYLAHSLNVVSPFSGRTEPEPLCWQTSPAEILAGTDRTEASSRRAALRLWYERHAAWPILAEALERAFD